jgi:hypothetical protein
VYRFSALQDIVAGPSPSPRRRDRRTTPSSAARRSSALDSALLSPLAPAPAEVRRLVAAAAQAEGLRIAADYCTGLAPDAVFVAALQADEVALHDTATEG